MSAGELTKISSWFQIIPGLWFAVGFAMSSAKAVNAEGYLDTSTNESFSADEFKGIKDM